MNAGRARTLDLLGVSRETAAALDIYVALLRQWQQRINLVAPSTLSIVWPRHILDSGQLALIAPPTTRRWLDVGSGAGLPGLIVALILREWRTGVAVTLVESNRKKAAFLAEAIRRTNAPAEIAAERLETFVARRPARYDMVSARALAPLPELLEMTAPFLLDGAHGLFLKGREIDSEWAAASAVWRIEAERLPSLSSEEGCVLHVRALARNRPK